MYLQGTEKKQQYKKKQKRFDVEKTGKFVYNSHNMRKLQNVILQKRGI